MFSEAKWIWVERDRVTENQYVEFIHDFSLGSLSEDAVMYISADSDYAVYLNGQFVDCNQYQDYPHNKVYDVLDLRGKLRPGANSLKIAAHYRGVSCFEYFKGEPGIIYVIKSGAGSVVSGQDTRCRQSPSYHCGPIARVTPQLGFVFDHDAARDDGWLSETYLSDSTWSAACVMASSQDLPLARKRPVSKLQIKDRCQSRIVAQGLFKRDVTESMTVAELMQSDFLSARTSKDVFGSFLLPDLPCHSGIETTLPDGDGEGVYMIVDLGREEAGFLDIELDCAAGTVIDIAHGEHLDDLRVRAFVGVRNFANRYTSKAGRQRFTHYFNRLGARYLQLHVRGRGKLTLYYAGLHPADYPIEIRGDFRSPDGLQRRIYETSIRTLHLCMHEHYEDCVWREQSLYANDSRNQALCGYYCFGEYRFPAASFSLLGQSLRDDGFLELCAPGDIPITIPAFTMAWIMELADHLLYSGDASLSIECLPAVRTILDGQVARMQSGLLPIPQGEQYWHFYDWASGLDNTELSARKGVLDAPLNLFYCLALDSAAYMETHCGDPDRARKYRQCAQSIRDAFDGAFWDTQADAYVTYADSERERHFAELTQSLAIVAGVCKGDKASLLRRRLISGDGAMIETTLSQSLYKFEAVLQEPEVYGNWVIDKIAKDWGMMLFNGATSFWETLNGADDFEKAGSLCHGWSGIPVYVYQAYLLGIKPVEPGFRVFSFSPLPNVVLRASGVVPTPSGPISATWETTDGKLCYDLSSPECTQAIVCPGAVARRSSS